MEAVRESVPQFYHFVLSAYKLPFFVLFGSHVIRSAEAIKQEDPLGPFLF